MTATPRVPATELMSVEAARALTDQIRDDAEMLWAKIVDAYTGRVWQIPEPPGFRPGPRGHGGRG